MNSPDTPRPTLKEVLTMSKADKYTICYIYEGLQYLDKCKVWSPDGTYNYSSKCLEMSSFPIAMQQQQLRLQQLQKLLDHDGTKRDVLVSPDKGLMRYNPNIGQNTPLHTLSDWFFDLSTSGFIAVIVVGIFLLFCLYAGLSNLSSRFRTFIKSPTTNTRTMAVENDNGEICVGKIRYNPDKQIGQGSRGTFVFEGCYENNQDCAVKRIVAQNVTIADRERELLRSLKHNNLVRYFATEQDRQFIYIALELGACTLRQLVDDNKFDEFELSKAEVCKQSAEGLRHLHDSNIIHRDIKPENILISFPRRFESTDKRSVMITDFGLSKELNADKLETRYVSSVLKSVDGTLGWVAPEVLERRKTDTKSVILSKAADVFALGCLFHFVIFDGHHPFGDIDSRQDNILYGRIVIDKCATDKKEKNQDEFSATASDVISAMISHSPRNRPSMKAVLSCPLFWDLRQKLQFICEVSDNFEKNPAAHILDANNSQFFPERGGWMSKLSPALKEDLRPKDTSARRRSYNFTKMQDLLRVIRNKRHHFNECSEELKQELGESPDEYMGYFAKLFPGLAMNLYKILQPDYSDNGKLEHFYDTDGYIFN